jgi:hypothetical protein
MNEIKAAFGLIRESRRAYIIINLAYFGLIALGMVFTAVNRSAQTLLLDSIENSFGLSPFSIVLGAYQGKQLLYAAELTFTFNLIVGSFIDLTLPSLIVPFSGFLLAVARAILWGLIFSPSLSGLTAAKVLAGFLVFILMVLEGQGYILTAFAVYLQGRAFLFPARVAASSRAQGYLVGLKQTLRIYLLVIFTLAVAALYEAAVGIYILPSLR